MNYNKNEFLRNGNLELLKIAIIFCSQGAI